MENPTPEQHTTNINIQISSTGMARSRNLIPLFFAIALLSFFFSFFDLKCSNTKFASITGVNLVTGSKIKTDSLASGLNDLAGKFGDYSKPQTNEDKDIKMSPNVWAIIAACAALIGLIVILINSKSAALISTIIGAIGVIALIILQFDIKNTIDDKGKGFLQTDFEFGYWGALLFMAIAGLMSYFHLPKKTVTVQEPTPPVVNISEPTSEVKP